MALQRIQIGTYPNDGTGDTLRTSFTKVNENFQEVYNNIGAQANTANVINVAANRSTNVIFGHANAAFLQANVAYSYAVGVDQNMGYAFLQSNNAFAKANGVVINVASAFARVNTVYSFANTLSIQINDSAIGLRARTNLIYTFANTINQQLNDTTNGLKARTNLIYTFANTVHAKVNTNYSLTNVTFNRTNSVYTLTNAAFGQANTAYAYGAQLAALIAQLTTSKLSNTSGVTFAGSLFFPLGSRVGLGTNAPSGTLHIKNNTDNPLVLMDSDGTQSMTLRFRRQGTNLWDIFNDYSTSDLVFSSSTQAGILRVANEGNVGIGIIPQFKLDVNGTANFRATARFNNIVTVTIGAGAVSQRGIASVNPDGIGIYGEVTRQVGGPDGSIGVHGKAYSGTGVKGEAQNGPGVVGISVSQNGVFGQSTSATGGFFQSTSGYAVYARSTSFAGILAESNGIGSAVNGYARGSGYGIIADAQNEGVGGYFRSRTGPPLVAAAGAHPTVVNRFIINNDGSMLAQAGSPTLMNAYMCRAWASFIGIGTTGNAVPIYGSGNISSVICEGQGFFRVNFATPMPDSNYSVSLAMQENGDAAYFMQRKSYGNQYMILCNGDKARIVTPNYFRCMTMFGNFVGGGFAAQVHISVFR